MTERPSPAAFPARRRASALARALGVAVGAAATVGLLFSLHALSTRILPPEGAERAYLDLYLLLPGGLPALAALAVGLSVPRLAQVTAAALLGAVAIEVAVLAAFACGAAMPLAAGPLIYGPPGPKASLEYAGGIDPATEPEPGPLSTWTAAELSPTPARPEVPRHHLPARRHALDRPDGRLGEPDRRLHLGRRRPLAAGPLLPHPPRPRPRQPAIRDHAVRRATAAACPVSAPPLTRGR